jgi:hypothetical protein
MDEIYSKATQVNVHLGSGDVKSDIAIEAVKRLFFAYLPALYAKNIGFGQEMTRRRYEEVADEVTGESSVCDLCLFSARRFWPVVAFSLEFPYGKLHGLFRLPWFQRTWVIQEVALARKVMFYCGDHLLAFDVLAAAADFTRLPYSKANGLAHHWKFYLDPHHTVAEFIRRRGQGENVEHIYGILKLLSVTFGRDATKPEDKIHGLYGCAKRLGLNWPIPDYTKSVAQVYTEVTLACLNEDGSLDVLERAEGAAALEFELPSWVPNFSKSIRESSPTERPTWNMPSKRNDMISGRSQCQWSIMPGGRRLKVLGRRLDQVAAVSEPWNIDISTTMLGGATRNSGEIWKNLIDCIPSWLEVVLQRNRNDGRGRKAADVIVDMQDLAHLMVNGHPSPTEPPAQIIEDLVSSLNSARVPANLSLRSRERIFEHITHLMGKLVFRTSTKNYLGTGSCSSSSGDLVVVLHGMAVPCLMRPCPEGFTFVGAAFVDKILDGEFWSAGSNADDEWFMLM